MSRTITKREVTEAELKAFLAANPGLKPHGSMYVQPTQVGAQVKTLWQKPMAYSERGKFFIIEEA